MDKGRIKGEFHRARGKLKEIAGKSIGNRRLEVEGKFDKAKGKVETVLGRVKEKIRAITR